MATGKDILAIASQEIGTKESPANSNHVKYNTWYYGREVSGSAYPWCMAFVQWCYTKAGIPLPFKTPSCGALLRWYLQKDEACIVPLEKAAPGDIVIFDFPGGADTDHTGIFEGAGKSTVTTVDGNTGTTSDANGGAVMRRTRSRSTVKAVIHPRELDKEDEIMPQKRYNTMAEIEQAASYAVATINKLIDKKALTGYGKKDANGKPADLDLSEDMLRTFVVNDRMGLYK